MLKILPICYSLGTICVNRSSNAKSSPLLLACFLWMWGGRYWGGVPASLSLGLRHLLICCVHFSMSRMPFSIFSPNHASTSTTYVSCSSAFMMLDLSCLFVSILRSSGVYICSNTSEISLFYEFDVLQLYGEGRACSPGQPAWIQVGQHGNLPALACD